MRLSFSSVANHEIYNPNSLTPIKLNEPPINGYLSSLGTYIIIYKNQNKSKKKIYLFYLFFFYFIFLIYRSLSMYCYLYK
jgi:hypothetical protein